MNKRISKRMSWVLRHGAREAGLDMDAAGWVHTEVLRRWLAVGQLVLDEVVAGNDKHRFEVRGDRIRASQGHSLAGTPVTVEGLEASWLRVTDRVEPLWHGTRRDAVAAIRATGLLPMDRTHVHLAGARDDKVGKRAGVQVLVQVCPVRLAEAGQALFRSPNGVWLARGVPPSALLALEGAD